MNFSFIGRLFPKTVDLLKFRCISYSEKELQNDPNIIRRFKYSRYFMLYKYRSNFPHPRESKRILVHGWNKRMSTESGRKILMNKILKGRHVLAH